MYIHELIKNAPNIGEIVPPVCALRENLAVNVLIHSLQLKSLPIVETTTITHGDDLKNLSTTEATCMVDDGNMKTLLVLKCPANSALEGMMTGTSRRKRVYRYFYQFPDYSRWNNVNSSLMHDLEHVLIFTSIPENKRKYTDYADYLEILMTLMKLTKINSLVGDRFESNINIASKWFKGSGKIVEDWLPNPG